MSKPPSFETQNKTLRRDVRNLRSELMAVDRNLKSADATNRDLRTRLADASTTIATLREAVAALTRSKT